VVQIHSPRPLFLESMIYVTPERHENAESAWSETKRCFLTVVGRERSLFFEFIALRQDFCPPRNPILGRLGTTSALWDEKPKSSSRSASRKTRSCYCVDCGQSSEKMSTVASACEGQTLSL
jgi:hypothetical protein